MSPAMKILVVDDDPYIVEFLAAVLEAEGYPVVTASDGQEALQQLDSQRPGLVLLDLCMPVMNGEEFIFHLRDDGRDRVPVVVMTALDDARRLARNLGAEGWLQKPFDLDRLLETVAGLTN